jgi:ABC-type multidrug transport system permease subunit
MPWIFKTIGDFLPATYFIDLNRAIVLRGASFVEFWPSLAILALMAAALFALCSLKFRQKIA